MPVNLLAPEQTVVLVEAQEITQVLRAEAVTYLALRHHRATMEAMALKAKLPVMEAVVAAVQEPQALMEHLAQGVMEAMG